MSTGAFRLRPGVPADVEAMRDTFLDAFSGNAVGRTFFPRSSPTVRKFSLDAFAEEIHDANAHFMVVEDPSTSPATFIGFAKWNRVAQPASQGSSTSQGASAPPPDNWPEDGDRALASVFFRKLADMHEEIMGERPHWYLENISTKSQFQGRGAGGMMLQWGVDMAEKDGVECYLDATPQGKPLYEKFGFQDTLVWPFFDDTYKHSFMVRQIRGSGKAATDHLRSST